jgi:hypothetical protein
MTTDEAKKLLENWRKEEARIYGLDKDLYPWVESLLSAQALIVQTEERERGRALVAAMQDILSDEPSLLLDVLGIAFYKDTGIWPLFKSAPLGMYHALTDEQRSQKYDEWIKTLDRNQDKHDKANQ